VALQSAQSIEYAGNAVETHGSVIGKKKFAGLATQTGQEETVCPP
jgi:hypothetical protein